MSVYLTPSFAQPLQDCRQANQLVEQHFLYMEKEQYTAAAANLEQALTCYEKTNPNSNTVATILDLLANVYVHKGDKDQAEALLRKVVTIIEQQKYEKPEYREHELVQRLDGLVKLYLDEKKYSAAESILQRILAEKEKVYGKISSEAVGGHNRLADLYKLQGKYEQAEHHFQQALEIELALARNYNNPNIVHQSGRNDGVISALENLAQLYREQNSYAKAEAFLKRALDLRKQEGGMLNSQYALNNLISLNLEKGDLDRGESLLEQNLADYRKEFVERCGEGLLKGQSQPLLLIGKNYPEIADILKDLALVQVLSHRVNRAVYSLTQSNAIEEAELANLLNYGLRKSSEGGSEGALQAMFLRLLKSIDRNVSLHLQFASENSTLARLALETVLQRKGRLLQLMSERVKVVQQQSNPRNRKLLEELAAVRSELSALRPDAASEEIQRLKWRLWELETQLGREADPQAIYQYTYVCPPEEKSGSEISSLLPTVASIQSRIPAGAALIEFIRYQPVDPQATLRMQKKLPDHYAAYTLTPSGEPRAVDLGTAEDIDQNVSRLLQLLRNPDIKVGQVRQLARKIYDEIVYPLRQSLGDIQTLLISPDSQLNLLPFAALVDEKNHYLMETFSISYLTSGRDLKHLQKQIQGGQRPVIIANPSFGLPNAAISTPSSGNGRGVAQELTPNFATMTFTQLEGTAEEAGALSKLLPDATVLTGDQATVDALKRLRSPTLLHIASHAFFLPKAVSQMSYNNEFPFDTRPAFFSASKPSELNSRTPTKDAPEDLLLRSGLVLAGANLHAEKENGVLTALEASSLDLQGTKLVVLSACQTGIGNVIDGEGVYGLRRAFAVAGTESQLLSLWKVDDEQTKDLMVAYYQRLKENEGRSEALRQTQLEMLQGKKGEQYKHPYYWASFILSGDWTPIGLAASKSLP